MGDGDDARTDRDSRCVADGVQGGGSCCSITRQNRLATVVSHHSSSDRHEAVGGEGEGEGEGECLYEVVEGRGKRTTGEVHEWRGKRCDGASALWRTREQDGRGFWYIRRRRTNHHVDKSKKRRRRGVSEGC